MIKIFTSKTYKYLAQALLVICFAGYKPACLPVVKSAPSHIVFIEDSFTEALKQGKAQNKYIFVDAYATWCGPCKMLKARTFTDAKAAAFYNSNFVNVSIDMEKGDGPRLAAAWQLQAYPTLIVFNPQGKPVLGTVGFLKADDLIKFGKAALAK
jgi:thioredoxin 1